MDNTFDILKNMNVKDDSGFIRNDIRDQAITEHNRLKSSFERILLDIKFMIESDIIPEYILDDIIYQRALELMSPEFMKVFNNESENRIDKKIIPIEQPLAATEVWVDNTLVAVYYGQDAIDVELGKIPIPQGAKLKIVDF